MCVVELDEADVFVERLRRARKAHVCTCCRRRIEPGEDYISHFSAMDGDVLVEKCCGDCDRDREEFAAVHHGAKSSPSWFPEMLSECISEGDPEDTQWEAMRTRIVERGSGA